MPEWLDLELSHRLAPTVAPDDLWARVCTAPEPGRRLSQLFAVPLAAAVTLVLAGALYFFAHNQPAPTPYRSNNPVAGCVRCHT